MQEVIYGMLVLIVILFMGMHVVFYVQEERMKERRRKIRED